MSGIYIHIPYCKSKCSYCDFYSVTELDTVHEFLNALEVEVKARAEVVRLDNKKIKVSTIYFGGGTPSLLKGGYVARIVGMLYDNFDVDINCEITLEANPDTVSKEFIEEVVAAGVNRISLGVQSHCNKILKAINRPHKFSDVKKAINLIDKCGIRHVSVDAMVGLPNQDKRSILGTLRHLVSFKNVKHISVYALTVEVGTSLYKSDFAVKSDDLADFYDLCVKYLADCGFDRYEVSNFALTGFESRHNQKYWTSKNYFGFGAGAHSLVDGVRLQNPSDLNAYIKNPLSQISHTLSKEEMLEEAIILGLRTVKGLDLNRLKQEFCYDLLKEKTTQISELVKLGLVEVCDNTLRLADKAFYIMDSIVLKLI